MQALIITFFQRDKKKTDGYEYQLAQVINPDYITIKKSNVK
jgi:hypothetical protein